MDRTEPTPTCSYADLRRIHEAGLTAQGRSSQQVKNQLSSLNALMRFLGRADSSCFIEDFNGDFDSRLNSYAQHAVLQGLSKVTIENRLSHLRALLVTARKIINESIVQESFTETLEGLLKANNMTIPALARRIGYNSRVMYGWTHGKRTPRLKTIKIIEKIEDVFGLPRSTLVKLTSGYEPTYANNVETAVSKRRKEFSRLSKDTYAYRIPSVAIEQEWNDFVYFNTAPFLINGMKRNTSWRVKPVDKVDKRYRGFGYETQDGICVTSGMHWGIVSLYFGYLLQNGFIEEQLSIALLTDSQLITAFMEFKKQRSGVYSSAHKVMLLLCATVMRPETGYLWQKPEFGNRLRTPVSAGNWHEWCRKNRQTCLEILWELSRGGHLKKSRNPFDPIANIVSRQHPIQALFDMVASMQRCIPFLSQPVNNALRCRDLLLIKLLISNPLRIHNFAMMTWRRDNSGNLYQDSQGYWRLRFEASDFKNQRGAASTSYDVALTTWLYPELVDYLENHRQLLYGADKSDKVFLAYVRGGTRDYVKYSDAWGGAGIGVRVFTLTKKFIPDCPGFGPHAFRHIIATEYIKNNPNGFQVAANILHDKLTTVLKAYAHLKVSDGFSFWTAYLDNQISTHSSGEADHE